MIFINFYDFSDLRNFLQGHSLKSIFRLVFFRNDEPCITTKDSPNNQAENNCVIPFIYEGLIRTSCITDNDPDGRFWCSTQTYENGTHIRGKGFWGYCNDQCNKRYSYKVLATKNYSSSSERVVNN